MKRVALLPALALVAVSTVALTAPSATAAGAHVTAQVALQHKIDQHIDRVDDRLAQIESSHAVKGLDAQVRAEVRANIDADQEALADLSVQVDSTASLDALRDLRAQVQDYQTSVYAQAVTALQAADRLDAKIDQARAEVSLDVSVQGLLDQADTSLTASVDGAVELDATSSQGEVREVRADLKAAVAAYTDAVD